MVLSPYKMSGKVVKEILPASKLKIFRQTKRATTVKPHNASTVVQPPPTHSPVSASHRSVTPAVSPDEYRENEMKIQMLSRSLYQQIFNRSAEPPQLDTALIHKHQQNLIKHGIKPGETDRLVDVSLRLPPLRGANIEEHFFNIATEQVQPYRELLAVLLAHHNTIPPMPSVWSYEAGWTHYCRTTQQPQAVPFPTDDAIVFDIEVCVQEGSAPTLATALGKSGWYSWTSQQLRGDNGSPRRHRYSSGDLIPLESTDAIESGGVLPKRPRCVIGHNVSYDRARVKEQYWLAGSGTRFLDTMSMHVCVSGVTSYQRAMLKAKREMPAEDRVWSGKTSLNSLAEVYRLYCNDAVALPKEKRNVFVDGSLTDIRNDFQSLMHYCATDVLATMAVLVRLYPLFVERFPHPATLAGMLEIGMAYLPVTANWKRYIQEANLTYEDFNIEVQYLLERRANEACRLQHGDAYKRNLWMWDQDWSTQVLKFNKTKAKRCAIDDSSDTVGTTAADDAEMLRLERKFGHLMDMKEMLPARRPLLPGYPAWYRKLCEKNTGAPGWTPGPSNIGTGMQVAPKLLALCWEGYPLHYIKGQGWGFLVPFKTTIATKEYDDNDITVAVPIEELQLKCPVIETKDRIATADETDVAFSELVQIVEVNLSKKDYYRKRAATNANHPSLGSYNGTGVWCDQVLNDCCWFLKLPHKDGATNRVGNPLARDFLNKFAENVLSGDGHTAERVIKIARMLSYWRNNRERIQGQMVVWQPPKSDDTIELGAIVPQIVVCGTLTRRVMEPTWMTASNAQRERIGSELRGIVQAPPGYRFVGADVDSQELWIASVLGDASETGCHGATPFGWMTLSGTKANETDMHSVTAKAVGISRDHAKVINYARIYGAGQTFAERLLRQFNPTFSEAEAKSKAQKMFALTKGRKMYWLRDGETDFLDKGYTRYEAMRLAAMSGRPVNEMFQRPRWAGGTESAMFNRLEEIAGSQHPVTPFLQCRISRALEPLTDVDDRFLQTRVNWVVQSGAVDFLHLMLVCMRWLMADNVRFCLSFHDEVRYLVPEEQAYRAALAMHTTNLLTRSFCASCIGMPDLPQSIAFFTSVEVDTVLRKDATAECTTPSNPHGLAAGYGVAAGESLTIVDAIERCGDGDIAAWPCHKMK